MSCFSRYTSKNSLTGNDTSVYAIVLQWPNTDLVLGAPSPTETTKVNLLGYPDAEITWSEAKGGMILHIPVIPFNKMPCQWAWVFKITGLKS